MIEQSRYVDNNFWWNDGAIAGWITSPEFANRPVRALVFTSGFDITGQTDTNGRFSLPLPADLREPHCNWSGGAGDAPPYRYVTYAAVAIQHTNGNWHTVEQSRYVDNNFWWNNQAVAGWITSSQFANRPVRAILFTAVHYCIG